MTVEEFRARYPRHGATNPIPRFYDADLFIKQYPGIFSKDTIPYVKKWFEFNESLRSSPRDLELVKTDSVPEDYPGFLARIEVTKETAWEKMCSYDTENKPYMDAEYAKSLGFRDMLAYPALGVVLKAIDPFPRDASHIFTPCNISHRFTSFQRICLGDILYAFRDEQSVQDCTPPEGSIVRSCAVTTRTSTYNQRGELVCECEFNIMEHLKVFKKPEFAADAKGITQKWDAPNWWLHPRHRYTDGDWEFIKSVWRNEKRQGAEPLYWEDIKIGDRPAWTLEGPIDDCDDIGPLPDGTVPGDRTYKKEMLDPEIFKTMKRGETDGIWRPADWKPVAVTSAAQFNAANSEGGDDRNSEMESNHRFHFANYFGSALIFRHICDWAGDLAFVSKMGWSIMSPASMEKHGKGGLPTHPNYQYYYKEAPDCRGTTFHGLEGDIALMKSYVADKYVIDGKPTVRLIWWLEDILGEVWQEGMAEVQLPSKGRNI